MYYYNSVIFDGSACMAIAMQWLFLSSQPNTMLRQYIITTMFDDVLVVYIVSVLFCFLSGVLAWRLM